MQVVHLATELPLGGPEPFIWHPRCRPMAIDPLFPVPPHVIGVFCVVENGVGHKQ